MQKALLSSVKMDWCTPQDLFDKLNEKYQFTLDAAASENNAKCQMYFTPENNGLSQSWQGHRVFCNPPYGREISKWVEKAYKESQESDTLVVMLIPARTDTRYFHQYIFPHADIVFLQGRLKFTDERGNASDSAPFPSAIVIFGRQNHKTGARDYAGH